MRLGACVAAALLVGAVAACGQENSTPVGAPTGPGRPLPVTWSPPLPAWDGSR